jgi:predicted nuclease with TOPRIM domain
MMYNDEKCCRLWGLRMAWDNDKQYRFDHLRLNELAGNITDQERVELSELTAEIESAEAGSLAPAFDRMREQRVAFTEQVQRMQTENEALAVLLGQQEQLVTDARYWLAQLEQRHTIIQQTYKRLTGEALTHSTPS